MPQHAPGAYVTAPGACCVGGGSCGVVLTMVCMSMTGIELFAGGGGLALGLEKAGVEHGLVVEWDKHAVATLRHNRPQWNVVGGDVCGVDFSSWHGVVDVVSGGAPCQAFSYAGKKLGFDDVRGTLFGEFARCVKETDPRAFVFENVPGLVTHDKGRTFATIVRVFASLGYQIHHDVLDASYYGVGQLRKRLFVVGFRSDVCAWYEPPMPDGQQMTLRDALAGVPESCGAEYSQRRQSVLDLVPAGGCWRDLPQEIREREYPLAGKSGGCTGMARRLAWDVPCLTLTTSPVGKMTERCHPDETRPLTVREYARVQSFPDEWEFCGPVSAQYKQIGNAVPVELARRVGVSVVEALAGF